MGFRQDQPFHTHPIFDVQGESREWRAEAYPETRGIELQALGVCEEAGELAHAVLKYKQGIRGYDREKTAHEVADAIGDIFIYACGVADQLDINVVEAIVAAWAHVRERNITQGSDPGLGPSGVGCFSPANEVDGATMSSTPVQRYDDDDDEVKCVRCGVNIGQLDVVDGEYWYDNNGRRLCDPYGILMHTPVEPIGKK